MSRSRREFTKAVRVEIIKRATWKGEVHCEECGVATTRFEVDHILPDALATPGGIVNDKSKRLTAAEGKVLCSGSPESCHGRKFPGDMAVIAKAKRNEAKHLGIKGRPTALSGPSRAELNARKDARSAARGAKDMLIPRRSLYADAPPAPPAMLALPSPTKPS